MSSCLYDIWNFSSLVDLFFWVNMIDLLFPHSLRSLAECSRIPVVVTNQVRSQIRDEACQYSFQGNTAMITWSFCICCKYASIYSIFCAVHDREGSLARYDSHLVAALGINWAHSVTIRLVLEAKSGCYKYGSGSKVKVTVWFRLKTVLWSIFVSNFLKLDLTRGFH